MLSFLLALLSLALIFLILMDAFETMVLPRRVTRAFRYARLYYRNFWKLWRLLMLALPPGKRRESFLSMFGPLSLLGLFTSWVVALVAAFALLHWSLGSPLKPADKTDFLTYAYLSGTTFFTLGYGDVTPVGLFGAFSPWWKRALASAFSLA